MKILLTISYDGTNYFGWQRQKNVITVQQIVEEKLSLLLHDKIKIIGASRTDAKVHALDQKAMFKVETCPIPMDRFPLAINNFLPDDIVITQAKTVHENFHVRYDVTKKIYEYKILNADYTIPQYRNYCWHLKNKFDDIAIKNMLLATKLFIGTKDFSSFCSTGSFTKSNVRTVYDFSIDFNDKFMTFRITGNGFLYNMVRIIVGTIINLGLGKINLMDIEKIFATKKRIPECKTAPPQGLTLIKISYD